MNEELNRILSAVRNYTNTMDGKEGGTYERKINSSAKRLSKVEYTNKFGNTGLQFKLNAKNELIPLGNLKNKTKTLTLLESLRTARANENNLNETNPSTEAINRTIETIITALDKNIKDEAKRLEEQVKEQGEVEKAFRFINSAIDVGGDENITAGNVTFDIKNGEIDSITGSYGDLLKVSSIAKEMFKDNIVIEEIDKVIENKRKEEEEKENTQIQNVIKNLNDEKLNNIQESIREIARAEKKTRVDKHNKTITNIKTGVTSMSTEDDLEYSLVLSKFRYDENGNLKSYPGFRRDDKETLAILEKLLERDKSKSYKGRNLSSKEEALVNQLISALRESIEREEETNRSATPTPTPATPTPATPTPAPATPTPATPTSATPTPATPTPATPTPATSTPATPTPATPTPATPATPTSATPTPATSATPTPATSATPTPATPTPATPTSATPTPATPTPATEEYTEVRGIKKEEIQKRIDKYRETINKKDPVSIFPAVTPEDAAKYMEIIRQRKELAKEIEEDKRNGIDTTSKEKLLEELKLSIDELKDRLRKIEDGTLKATPEEIQRLKDLLEAYNYESRMIIADRARRKELVDKLKTASTDDLKKELDKLPEDLEYSEEKIKELLKGVKDGETKERLETLLRSYQYEREMKENTPTVEDKGKAEDVLPELEDLIHTTSDNVPYVNADEVEKRLQKYKKERDELLAIQKEDNSEGLTAEEQSNIRKRMAEILLGKSLDKIDEIDENEIISKLGLDTSWKEKLQKLKKELKGIEEGKKDRIPEIRIRMAEILGKLDEVDLDGLDDDKKSKFEELRKELSKSEVQKNTKKANEIRSEMAKILGEDALVGIENSNEHAIQYQLDDNEIDEFQELREELKKNNKDLKKADQMRNEMLNSILDGIENANEHAIQYQLDDNEKDEFQELRDKLKNPIKSRKLTPEEERRLEQLNNIIEELESLPITLIRTDRETPEPETPETETPETPETPETETPETPETALVKKGFWRIVQETSSHEGKPAGSWAITIRNIAKAPLIKPTKIKDGGLGWLGLPLSILSAPVKGLARIANKFTKADDKYAEMYNNVRDLYENHPEDFETLITGMREDVMRKNKINGLYLKAIQDVLGEVLNDKLEVRNSKIKEYQQYIALYESQMDGMIQQFVETGILSASDAKFLFSDKEELSPDELAELDRIENKVLSSGRYNRANLDTLQTRFQKLRENRNAIDKESRELEAETEIDGVQVYKNFERGAINKEKGRLNIGVTLPGIKFLSRNNPDNRDMIARFADEEEKAIAARMAGHEQEALDHERKIEKIRDESTNEVKFGPLVLSRGKAIGKQDTNKLIEMVQDISQKTEITQEQAFMLLKGKEGLTEEQQAQFTIIENAALANDKISRRDLDKAQSKFKKIEGNIPQVVIIPSDQNDTRARQLMANVAVAATSLNFFNSFRESHNLAKEQERLDGSIEAHNHDLDKLNKEYEKSLVEIKKSIETGTPDAGTYKAFDSIINQNIQGILAKYHDSYVTLSNQVTGGEWPFEDDQQMHEMVEALNKSYLEVKKAANTLAKQGDYEGAIEKLVKFNNSSVQPEMKNVMKYEMGVWKQAIKSGSQYSDTYKSMIDVTSKALNTKGNINHIVKEISNSSIKIPTINGAMEEAKHMGEFTIQMPSTWIPSLVALGATVGNSLFGEMGREAERQQAASTHTSNHFFRRDNEGER